DDRWMYVTDGGHYENLGLVEILRSGSREIYCFDASGDSTDTFGTLADAMRLAREELKIEIGAFDPKCLKPDEHGVSKLGVWACTIQDLDRGHDGPKGWLILAKLEVPSRAPF